MAADRQVGHHDYRGTGPTAHIPLRLQPRSYLRNTRRTHQHLRIKRCRHPHHALSCGGGLRGKSRRKEYINKGSFPTFSTLHFPVGGDRFRPGLEDVLQMAIYEFHIDATNEWQQHIEASREEYRTRQLTALIREFPDIAYDTLKEDGRELTTRPERPQRADRTSMLIRY